VEPDGHLEDSIGECRKERILHTKEGGIEVPEERIRSLLLFYLKRAWEAAGLVWGKDNTTEVGEIADAITEIAERAAREKK
jgi:hypothetical protein